MVNSLNVLKNKNFLIHLKNFSTSSGEISIPKKKKKKNFLHPIKRLFHDFPRKIQYPLLSSSFLRYKENDHIWHTKWNCIFLETTEKQWNPFRRGCYNRVIFPGRSSGTHLDISRDKRTKESRISWPAEKSLLGDRERERGKGRTRATSEHLAVIRDRARMEASRLARQYRLTHLYRSTVLFAANRAYTHDAATTRYYNAGCGYTYRGARL